MTSEQIAAILTRLKTDIGIKNTTAYDERLGQIIESSYQSIIEEGASTLDPDKERDIELIVMYSNWVWNGRRTGDEMHRMLRWNLNNRIFSEKARN